jgi:hypothetical protein
MRSAAPTLLGHLKVISTQEALIMRQTLWANVPRSLACLLFVPILSVAALSQSTSDPAKDRDPVKPGATAQADAPPTQLSKEKIPNGSGVYVAPINGYESYLIAGLMKKQVPVVVVNSPDKADYEISGVAESQQAGWAKMFFMGSQASSEQASIVMRNVKTGTVVWGYNVNKGNSARGKQSTAEACAKHLKARIEGRE